MLQSAETDSVFTHFSWQVRGPKHVICITENKVEVTQRVSCVALLRQRTSLKQAAPQCGPGHLHVHPAK